MLATLTLAAALASTPALTATGAAGARGRITVTATTDAAGVHVEGRLPDGRRIEMEGPAEPADLFILEARRVFIARIGKDRVASAVVLYDSSRIGPGHGTDHRALVYMIGTSWSSRVPEVELELEGAATEREARHRLRLFGR